MFFRTLVKDWLTKRDGKSRVSRLDYKNYGGRTYLLNASHVFNPRIEGSYTRFEFFDAMGNRKESASTVLATITLANLTTAMNTSCPTKFVTLPFFKDNDSGKSSSNTIIPSESISFIDSYRVDPAYTWVIYYINDFKRVEVLCEYSMDTLEGLLSTTVIPGSSITWDSIIISLDSNTITFDSL